MAGKIVSWNLNEERAVLTSEDTMVAAWLGFIGYTALGFISSNHGSGVHQWDVPLASFITWIQVRVHTRCHKSYRWLNKLSNVLEVYYNPLIFVTKLSILIQYLRIFVPSRSGKTYWAIHTLIWVNLLFYLAVMLVQIMSCLPRKKIWDPLVPGTCVDLADVLISGAVINVVSDFSMLILPIAKVWQLQITTARKWGISAVFGTGLLWEPETYLLVVVKLIRRYSACVSSIMRMVNNIKFSTTDDVTFQLTPVALWTLAEITSGIVAGCLPVLPAFFRHFRPKITSTFNSYSRKVWVLDMFSMLGNGCILLVLLKPAI